MFYKDWTTKASKIGKEVNTTRPVDVIQREHDALRKGLDERDRKSVYQLNDIFIASHGLSLTQSVKIG